MGIALLALGWASIVLSVRYEPLLPSSLALEVTGGALLLVGVGIRILAFNEIPSTYHIKNLATSGAYAKTRNPIYLAFILMIVGVAVLSRGVLVLIWAFLSVFVLYRIARSRADFWRASSVIQEHRPNVFPSILEY